MSFKDQSNPEGGRRADASTEDYDLIDAISFVWRARWVVAVTLLLATTFALTIGYQRSPIYYVVQIPVSVVPDYFTNSPKAAERFNKILMNTEFASALFEFLEKDANPEVKNWLQNSKWTKPRFVALQASGEPTPETPVTLRGESGNFFLEMHLPKRDSEGKFSLVFIDVINRVLKVQSEDKRLKEDHRNQYQMAVNRYIDVLKLRDLEQVEFYIELAKIKAKLFSEVPDDLKFGATSLDVSSLIGLLLNKGVLSDSDAKEIWTKEQVLTANAAAVHQKFIGSIKEAHLAVQNEMDLYESAARDTAFVPAFRVDTLKLENSIQSGSFQKTKLEFLSQLPVAILFGTLIGLFFYGFMEFARKEKVRFKAIFR